MNQQKKTGADLSEVIAENFGANASYVEGLLSRFRSNPELVDESWRAYFAELLGEAPVTPQAEPSENGRGVAAAVISEETAPAKPARPAATKAGAAAAP